jgi:hypothetical protein
MADSHDLGGIIDVFQPRLLQKRGGHWGPAHLGPATALSSSCTPDCSGAGGLDKARKWKSTKQQGAFLFDVKQLSSVFSARFASKLRQLKRQGKIKKYVPRDLIKKPWVVYAKQAFGTPESVLEYLGRYTHRVAISNH